MKRTFSLLLGLSTLVLIILVIQRIIKHPKNTSPDFETTKRMVMTYADIHTRNLTTEEYLALIRQHSKTNLNVLSADQRHKLFKKLKQFRECYSSPSFDAYKLLRMQPPYSLGPVVTAADRQFSDQHGSIPTDKVDLLRLAWQRYNGTNRISQFDPASIVLYVARRHAFDIAWRRPSNLKGFTQPVLRCWDNAIRYSPTPADLVSKNGSFLLATIDQYVRFNSTTIGPATPLRLAFYWDPENECWRPLALCTTIKVGNYNTLF